MTTHKLLSPSSLARFRACRASLNATKDLRSTQSEAAAEGTVAHKIGETCLRNGTQPFDYIGTTHNSGGFSFYVDAGMAKAVQEYVDYVTMLKKLCPGTLHIEARVEPPSDNEVLANFGGTIDALLIPSKGGNLHIIDYKHGAGLPVTVQDNDQLMAYAYCVMRSFDSETYTLSIVQPRCNMVAQAIQSVVYTKEELLKWYEELEPLLFQSIACTNPSMSDFNATEECRFCRYKPQCPAHIGMVASSLGCEVTQPTFNPPAIGSLSPEQIRNLIENSSKIESYLKSVRDYAYGELSNGNYLPGLKIVVSKSTSTWVDDALAMEWVKTLPEEQAVELLAPRKVLSLAQMKKELKKSLGNLHSVPEHLIEEKTNFTLVLDTDKRPAVGMITTNGFAEVEQVTTNN